MLVTLAYLFVGICQFNSDIDMNNIHFVFHVKNWKLVFVRSVNQEVLRTVYFFLCFSGYAALINIVSLNSRKTCL